MSVFKFLKLLPVTRKTWILVTWVVFWLALYISSTVYQIFHQTAYFDTSKLKPLVTIGRYVIVYVIYLKTTLAILICNYTARKLKLDILK